jgi:hypothetical protein
MSIFQLKVDAAEVEAEVMSVKGQVLVESLLKFFAKLTCAGFIDIWTAKQVAEEAERRLTLLEREERMKGEKRAKKQSNQKENSKSKQKGKGEKELKDTSREEGPAIQAIPRPRSGCSILE